MKAFAVALTTGLASADATAPRGNLNIDTSLIREGANPLLTWEISYPVASVDEIVNVEADNAVRMKGPAIMTVRILGADFRPGGRDAAVNLQVKLGIDDTWKTAFHGTDRQIDPSEEVFSARIEADTVVDFAGTGNLAGSRWTTSRNTLSKTRTVLALKDGDPVPAHLPAFHRGAIKDHLSPYVRDGKIALGPTELIYLIELGPTDPGEAGFDMQDLVAIASFEPIAVADTDGKEEPPEEEGATEKAPSLNPGFRPYVLPQMPEPAGDVNRKPFRSN